MSHGKQRTGPTPDGTTSRRYRKVQLWLPDVERETDSIHVAFRDRDVRPHGNTKVTDMWVVLDQDAPDVLVVRW